MPCQGCQRRKAAIIKQARRFHQWARKTPMQAREAIARRVRARIGARDGV